MNIITFDAAYCLYPRSTFQCNVNLALGKICDRVSACLSKYAERGWPVIPLRSLPPNAAMDWFRLGGARSVGDFMTWTVTLDTSNVHRRRRMSPRSQQFQWDPVLYNSWILSTMTNSMIVKPTFFIMKSAVFRYTYLCADKRTKTAFQAYADAYRDLDWRMARKLHEEQTSSTWTW